MNRRQSSILAQNTNRVPEEPMPEFLRASGTLETAFDEFPFSFFVPLRNSISDKWQGVCLFHLSLEGEKLRIYFAEQIRHFYRV